MYSVFRTKKFDKELLKHFSKREQKEVENFEKKQLVNNPYVGDSLGYKFLREKKVGGKRIYYLIYDDLNSVLLVAVSDKKSQQQTIDKIKSLLRDYYLTIKETIKLHDESDHV